MKGNQQFGRGVWMETDTRVIIGLRKGKFPKKHKEKMGVLFLCK